MRRDVSRDDLPSGSLWNAVDVIPGLGGKLRERGGWGNASDAITGVFAGADYVQGGIYAPFSGGAKNCAVALDVGVQARLVTFTSAGTVTDVGALNSSVIQNPVFHRDRIIVPCGAGASSPNSYDGTTLSTLGGTPPTALYATVYKDRTILGKTTANTNRIWFSGAGNPASWDTTNSYWDFTYPITGLAAVRGAILVFHDGHFSTLVGSTPPTVAGGIGDFRANDPLFDVGCGDARSIAYYGDKVVFANPGGIFITDGASYDDLTALCGMKSYWADLAIQSSWTLAGGVHREHYFYTVMNGSTFVDAGMIDLRRLTWWRLSNVDSIAFWPAATGQRELYFGRRGAARVGKLDSIFSPASAVKNDGDGDAVASTGETGFYRGRGGQKGFKWLYSTFHLQDYATDNPTVTWSYIKTPEATSYTSLGSLSENTAEERKRLSMGFAAQGVALKWARANAGDFRLNALEVDFHAREGSR